MEINNDAAITLVTGTRKGIGRHLAEHYLSSGHRVIGCSRGPVESPSSQYLHFRGDVADEEFVKSVFLEIKKRYNRLDHLINNAGIATMNHFLLTPAESVRSILSTNLVGAFLFCREAAKLMKMRDFGRIVNFSSVAVPLRLEGEAIYAASKAALVTLTQVLARELAPWHITVNAVGPGPVETDLIKNVPKEKIHRILSAQAIKSYAQFQDISNVIDFFLRPESSLVTGQTVYLGGV